MEEEQKQKRKTNRRRRSKSKRVRSKRESKIMKKGVNRRRGKPGEGRGKERMLKRGGEVKPGGKTVLSRNIC